MDTTRQTPVAELVVQNGRLAGTRRVLSGPLTFIGRAPGCDVRLNVDGVHPLHCLLALGPHGLLVRDLETGGGTFVNGQRISVSPLHDGDQLTLGTFQFRLEWRDGGSAEVPVVPQVEAERDALRIQVAAVAAQQAALLEDESRLQRQEGALRQQQEQLAGHLEEKRLQLVQLTDHLQAARAALRRENDERERQAARQGEDCAQRQAELDALRQQLLADRHKIKRLRRRLKQRFHRRWAAESGLIRKRESVVSAEILRLEQEDRKQRHEREQLAQARLEVNGDAELGKRQVLAEWENLRVEQHRWKREREEKEADLATRIRAVQRGERVLSDAERALGDDKHAWEHRRKIVEQEVEGHENRLNNLRRKWNELQAERARNDTISIPALTVEAGVPVAEVLEGMTPAEAHLRELEDQINRRVRALDAAADSLTDQRLQVVEHWRILAEIQSDWQRRHNEVAHELTALAASLPRKEQDLNDRQGALEAAESNLRRRQGELSNLRQHLEGWAARVRLRESTWESERDRLLAQANGREEIAEKHLVAVVELRQRWTKRRRQELDLLRAEREACEKARQESGALRQDCWKRGLVLEERERELSEKALALEEYREEFVLRSHDAAAVEAKLERIRKRWVQQNAATMRDAAEQFQRLQDESTNAQQRGRELLKFAEELATREATLAQRQSAWEEQLTLAESKQGELDQQLRSAKAQRDRAERQIADLRGEVERMARVLLDECDAGEAPLARAA